MDAEIGWREEALNLRKQVSDLQEPSHFYARLLMGQAAELTKLNRAIIKRNAKIVRLKKRLTEAHRAGMLEAARILRCKASEYDWEIPADILGEGAQAIEQAAQEKE